MRFRLTYDGPLASNGSPEKKQDIRRLLCPQLKNLWEQEPLKRMTEALEPGPDTTGMGLLGACRKEVGAHVFAFIVQNHFAWRAELDILMLRPGDPGELIKRGGDIDNRLKTLFDALSVPTEDQVRELKRKGWQPDAGQVPFHCLLSGDDLITKVSVETDRLLGTAQPGHVKLLIGVRLYEARKAKAS